MNHAHHSITDIHLTPPPVIKIARNVMGKIDLDPCTSEEINDFAVNASMIFTQNGIELLRRINPRKELKVWINPPGGKTGNKSNLKLWLETAYDLWLDGKIEQFFFLFFNREFIGGTETVDLSRIPMLNFYDRLKYYSYNEVKGEFVEGNWTTLFQSQSNSKPVVTFTFDEELKTYWASNMKGGKIGYIKTYQKLKDAEKWAKENDYAFRIWTNSPTHPSTLAYFPPRTNSGWSEGLKKLEQYTPADLGRWVLPQFPVDLGAK